MIIYTLRSLLAQLFGGWLTRHAPDGAELWPSAPELELAELPDWQLAAGRRLPH